MKNGYYSEKEDVLEIKATPKARKIAEKEVAIGKNPLL